MEIKFRGRTSKDRIIYGYLVRHAQHKTFHVLDEHNELWKVKNASVAQLATHDDEDNEVYTGDEVHADNGEDYRVELRPVFVNLDGGEILLNPPKHFKLKG